MALFFTCVIIFSYAAVFDGNANEAAGCHGECYVTMPTYPSASHYT